MAEELQGLLDRIQTEGIEKAEAEKATILGNAKAEAAKIIEKAKEEAATIVKKANEEAEISVNKGNAAIRQAARDVLIALRADIEARLKALVTESIGQAMTPDVMGKIILEMVKAYREKNPTGDATVELLLPQSEAGQMAELLKDKQLAVVSRKCTRQKPAQRYVSARAVAQALCAKASYRGRTWLLAAAVLLLFVLYIFYRYGVTDERAVSFPVYGNRSMPIEQWGDSAALTGQPQSF